jgi:hypothetical protein
MNPPLLSFSLFSLSSISTCRYIFSHTTTAGSVPGSSTNQVAIFLPSASHPAHGAVRALIRDENDGESDLLYLDSDGVVAGDNHRGSAGVDPAVDVDDGGWHMVTLTTLGRGEKGYALYVDGRLAGELNGGAMAANGSAIVVPIGGEPALMTGPVFLCARSDLSTSPEGDRYYDGQVTHLMLFDKSLEGRQIEALYDAYATVLKADEIGALEAHGTNSDEVVIASILESAVDDGDGGTNAGLVAGIVFGVIGAVALAVVLGALAIRRSRSRRAK